MSSKLHLTDVPDVLLYEQVYRRRWRRSVVSTEIVIRTKAGIELRYIAQRIDPGEDQ